MKLLILSAIVVTALCTTGYIKVQANETKLYHAKRDAFRLEAELHDHSQIYREAKAGIVKQEANARGLVNSAIPANVWR